MMSRVSCDRIWFDDRDVSQPPGSRERRFAAPVWSRDHEEPGHVSLRYLVLLVGGSITRSPLLVRAM